MPLATWCAYTQAHILIYSHATAFNNWIFLILCKRIAFLYNSFFGKSFGSHTLYRTLFKFTVIWSTLVVCCQEIRVSYNTYIESYEHDSVCLLKLPQYDRFVFGFFSIFSFFFLLPKNNYERKLEVAMNYDYFSYNSTFACIHSISVSWMQLSEVLCGKFLFNDFSTI